MNPFVKTYTYHSEIWLPRPVAEVFEFFSNAGNLQELTPPWVQFSILTPGPISMHPGSLIDYRIKIHGIPLRWRTEITEWEPGIRFVDEQRKGPYRLWRHEHRFESLRDGTLMTDTVHYAVYGGALIHALFVKADVERIFNYRRERMEALFGAIDESEAVAS